MMMQKKIKLKEYDLPYESCMGAWFIPDKICDDLIKYYYFNEKNITPGRFYNNVDKKNTIDHNIKHSLDLRIPSFSYNHYEIEQYIFYLHNIIKHFEIKYPNANTAPFYRITNYFNIQKYPKGGGFKTWHHERSAGLEERIFVFMTYLNDVKNGGTEFLHQKLKIPAKKGLTVFWPADWTHTHRGIITKKEEKIIATGWFEVITSK